MKQLKLLINEKEFTNAVNTCILKGEKTIPNLEYSNINFNLSLPIKSSIISVFQRDQGIPESEDFYFYKCTFSEKLRIDNYKGEIFFDDCIFEKTVDLTNTLFKKKARFRECTFKEKVKFDNTVFHDLADFWRSTFCEKTIFYKVDFHGAVVFSAATFRENVLFTYTLFEKVTIFRGSNFDKGVDLSLAIISGQLGLFDLEINDFDCTLDILDEVQYELAVSQTGEIPIKNKRETISIVKNHFQYKGDSVSAQQFALQESITHRKELYYKLSHGLNVWNNLCDYFLLSANRISNKHKSSYVRGALFTLFFGFILFYMALISTKEFCVFCEGNGVEITDKWILFQYYIVSLMPTHKFNYIKENPESVFYIFDFIGRIIIAYGIYQTIQAFRKYR